MCVLFFFQAEDGIRDLVRSRGLGDVYKRQEPAQIEAIRALGRAPFEAARVTHYAGVDADSVAPVSYTHLTLPTSDLV